MNSKEKKGGLVGKEPPRVLADNLWEKENTFKLKLLYSIFIHSIHKQQHISHEFSLIVASTMQEICRELFYCRKLPSFEVLFF